MLSDEELEKNWPYIWKLTYGNSSELIISRESGFAVSGYVRLSAWKAHLRIRVYVGLGHGRKPIEGYAEVFTVLGLSFNEAMQKLERAVQELDFDEWYSWAVDPSPEPLTQRQYPHIRRGHHLHSEH